MLDRIRTELPAMPSWSLVLSTVLLVALGRLAYLVHRLERKTAVRIDLLPLLLPDRDRRLVQVKGCLSLGW
jgi:hypothetical protein